MQSNWRKRTAKLTSNILNPFAVSLVIIIILSFRSTSSTLEAVKWAAILLALSVFPIFTIVVYLVRQNKLDGIFINPRQQRTKVYLLAVACATIGCTILLLLEAPLLLLAMFATGLAAIITFTGINLIWKISAHAAFIAASATVLTIVYGAVGSLAFLLVPLIAWARIDLKHHTPAQVAAGALIPAFIVVVVFHLFGLVGTTIIL